MLHIITEFASLRTIKAFLGGALKLKQITKRTKINSDVILIHSIAFPFTKHPYRIGIEFYKLYRNDEKSISILPYFGSSTVRTVYLNDPKATIYQKPKLLTEEKIIKKLIKLKLSYIKIGGLNERSN